MKNKGVIDNKEAIQDFYKAIEISNLELILRHDIALSAQEIIDNNKPTYNEINTIH